MANTTLLLLALRQATNHPPYPTKLPRAKLAAASR
jgi:hypothetical protein